MVAKRFDEQGVVETLRAAVRRARLLSDCGGYRERCQVVGPIGGAGADRIRAEVVLLALQTGGVTLSRVREMRDVAASSISKGFNSPWTTGGVVTSIGAVGTGWPAFSARFRSARRSRSAPACL